MKVLIIPDVHLKPRMFKDAGRLLDQGAADRALCLMDLADDWNQQFNLDLYEKTYDAAIRFAGQYPDTLWCLGNHDLSYVWNRRESGYSIFASRLVNEKMRKLREALRDPGQMAYVHRIDRALFSHGGLADPFVRWYVKDADQAGIDRVLERINALEAGDMWDDMSPIWLRPQVERVSLFREEEYLQVVGHTPVKKITRRGNLVSCDVFSTDRKRRPIGTREYPLVDTLTWEVTGLPAPE